MASRIIQEKGAVEALVAAREKAQKYKSDIVGTTISTAAGTSAVAPGQGFNRQGLNGDFGVDTADGKNQGYFSDFTGQLLAGADIGLDPRLG